MILNVAKGTVDFTNLGLYDLTLIKTQDGGLGVRITDFSKKDILHKVKGRRKLIQTDELTMYASWGGKTNDPEDSDWEFEEEDAQRFEDDDEQGSLRVPDQEIETPAPREVAKQAAENQELQEQETVLNRTQEKEMSGRPSPREPGSAERVHWKETGGRPSPRGFKDPDTQMRKEDQQASATAQSTPFFVGTSHKELRALLHARDNSEAWATMLEKEHPARDWCDAYQALQRNQDPKQSVLFTLLYYQNEQWLKARQITGLASKVMFASCREQYDAVQPPRQDALLEMPHGMLWPKLAICSANSDAVDHNFALSVVQELCAVITHLQLSFAVHLMTVCNETKPSKDKKVFWKSCSIARTWFVMQVRDAGGHFQLNAGGLFRSLALAYSEKVSQKGISRVTLRRYNWCSRSIHGIRGAHSRSLTLARNCANHLLLL
jgi:hypothetical protein